MKKIVIVEDNKSIVDFLTDYMSADPTLGVKSFTSGTKALSYLKSSRPDLLLLDLTLEDIRGENVLHKVRELYPKLPVIILTGDTDKDKEVTLFKMGADNYVRKPFDIEVLMARIKSKLERNDANMDENKVLEAKDLKMNVEKYTVERSGESIKLTAKEFELLRYMLVNKNNLLTRDKILNAVWGYDMDVETRVVDVHIGNLRKKIDRNYKPKLIKSLRGFGYKLEAK